MNFNITLKHFYEFHVYISKGIVFIHGGVFEMKKIITMMIFLRLQLHWLVAEQSQLRTSHLLPQLVNLTVLASLIVLVVMPELSGKMFVSYIWKY